LGETTPDPGLRVAPTQYPTSAWTAAGREADRKGRVRKEEALIEKVLDGISTTSRSKGTGGVAMEIDQFRFSEKRSTREDVKRWQEALAKERAAEGAAKRAHARAMTRPRRLDRMNKLSTMMARALKTGQERTFHDLYSEYRGLQSRGKVTNVADESENIWKAGLIKDAHRRGKAQFQVWGQVHKDSIRSANQELRALARGGASLTAPGKADMRLVRQERASAISKLAAAMDQAGMSPDAVRLQRDSRVFKAEEKDQFLRLAEEWGRRWGVPPEEAAAILQTDYGYGILSE
jgi:hypothetical protein